MESGGGCRPRDEVPKAGCSTPPTAATLPSRVQSLTGSERLMRSLTRIGGRGIDDEESCAFLSDINIACGHILKRTTGRFW